VALVTASPNAASNAGLDLVGFSTSWDTRARARQLGTAPTGVGRHLTDDSQRGQTSACGTPARGVGAPDAIDALEQIHPTITINATGGRIAFRPAYPFATFDYRRLRATLVDRRDDVEIAVAPFRDREPDGTLLLGARRARTSLIVDATGWRAVMARQSGGQLVLLPSPDPDTATQRRDHQWL